VLTDPDVIRVLIARLIATRCPVFAFMEGDDERYTTMLLEIEPTFGALIADELHPRAGHDRLRTGASLRLACRLDGVEVRFRSRVRAIDRDGAIAAYMLDMPAELDHRENRRLHRTRARGVTARLQTPEKDAVLARVVDISISGLSLAVSAPHALAEDECWDCNVSLPNGAVDAEVSIVRIRRATTRAHAAVAREDNIGARFGALSAHAARRIGHFMADTQRAFLRARLPSSRSMA